VPLDSPSRAWPWWPLLPIFPYGRRRTLLRTLVPGEVWSLEQLQGVFSVAVPIRMTVLRLPEGLLLYAPVAPTAECLALLRGLEADHGPVVTIVHPTSSGLEHKLPVPAMARAFPAAAIWVTPGQWSFPLSLPLTWLGFPGRRTRVLFDQGLPHGDVLEWRALGPVPLGPGPFLEATVLHRPTGTLVLTDALVAVSDRRPELLDLEPRPLLYHARDDGGEPLLDDEPRRRRGWRRLVLFASFFQPACLETVGAWYPFRWRPDWELHFERFSDGGALQVPPILEELVFPRHRERMGSWLRQVASLEVQWVVPAHFDAPVPATAEDMGRLAEAWEAGSQDRDRGTPAGADRALLRDFNAGLERLGVVPSA
jgi:hypothetical protein